MPELPEVETIRRSLVPRVVGLRIASVEARPARLRAGITPREWTGVVGCEVLAIGRRGKYLLVDLGGRTAVIHLGMSGRLVISASSAAEAPHTHLRLRFDGEGELRFIDPRRFGVAIVLPAGDLATFEPLARLGAEPLDQGAAATLVAAARRSRMAIRNLLLDQSVLAGIGNIYANEALARAGIRPARSAWRIAASRVERLAAAVREVLDDALREGGTTLADGGFVDAGGDAGAFAVSLRVYGRDGLPCAVCGATIRRIALGGRSAYYCPACQR